MGEPVTTMQHDVRLAPETLAALEKLVQTLVAAIEAVAGLRPAPLPDVDLAALSDGQISDLVHGRPLRPAEQDPALPPGAVVGQAEAMARAFAGKLGAAPACKDKPVTKASDKGRHRPRPFCDARKAIIRREWPLGTPVHEVARLLRAIPGEPFLPERIAIMAWNLGVSRPDGFTPDRSRAAKAAAAPVDPVVVPPEPPEPVPAPELAPQPVVAPPAPPPRPAPPPIALAKPVMLASPPRPDDPRETIDWQPALAWAKEQKLDVHGMTRSVAMGRINRARVELGLPEWRIVHVAKVLETLPPPKVGGTFGRQPQQKY